jgi:hypothetical protein
MGRLLLRRPDSTSQPIEKPLHVGRFHLILGNLRLHKHSVQPRDQPVCNSMVPIDSDSKGLDERGPTDRIDATQNSRPHVYSDETD